MNDEDLLYELIKIVNDLGWSVAVPNDEEEVSGLIIGTEEYISKITSKLD